MSLSDEARAHESEVTRREALAEAAARLTVVIADMERLEASSASLLRYAAEAQRLGIKLLLEGSLDEGLATRLAHCRDILQRLVRLSMAGA